LLSSHELTVRYFPAALLHPCDSACHRPKASLFGQEAYPALTGKAAALMHSLASTHSLDDGNKRLALLATVVFLRINGYTLDLTDNEAFDLTMSVAAGQLDADGIQKRLRLAQVPRDPPDPCILARTEGCVAGGPDHPSGPAGHVVRLGRPGWSACQGRLVAGTMGA
jgi:death-on-curing protein